jgi:hypothetical protein
MEPAQGGCTTGLRLSTPQKACARIKPRRKALVAPAACISIRSLRRSLCSHGFSGSGVASQIVTVPCFAPLAKR